MVVTPLKEKYYNLDSVISFIFSCILTISGYIYFALFGLPNIETFSGTINEKAPLIYMLLIFPFIGILVGDFIRSIVSNQNFGFKNKILFFELLILFTISFLRIAFVLPISGHSLILTFFLLMELIDYKSNNKIRIVIGFIVSFITVYYKLLLWKDPMTMIIGIFTGIIIFEIGHQFVEK
jgi:hypothetical protein